ncbi:hypothetical protein MIND_00669300 [Mycena indigotica]|uniref:Uncharacterized protein n=1 Tax=Mycena indigotica TaxID=2126181 RepID=A0A8H6SKK4_9AGAR|nr:uncharacterized protein MIND_00669300 [Mycena indigotica]KAF7301054.1 hypothetical protein MIND_00669300 [Mycena indigotica]
MPLPVVLAAWAVSIMLFAGLVVTPTLLLIETSTVGYLLHSVPTFSALDSVYYALRLISPNVVTCEDPENGSVVVFRRFLRQVQTFRPTLVLNPRQLLIHGYLCAGLVAAIALAFAVYTCRIGLWSTDSLIRPWSFARRLNAEEQQHQPAVEEPENVEERKQNEEQLFGLEPALPNHHDKAAMADRPLRVLSPRLDRLLVLLDTQNNRNDRRVALKGTGDDEPVPRVAKEDHGVFENVKSRPRPPPIDRREALKRLIEDKRPPLSPMARMKLLKKDILEFQVNMEKLKARLDEKPAIARLKPPRRRVQFSKAIRLRIITPFPAEVETS